VETIFSANDFSLPTSSISPCALTAEFRQGRFGNRDEKSIVMAVAATAAVE